MFAVFQRVYSPGAPGAAAREDSKKADNDGAEEIWASHNESWHTMLFAAVRLSSINICLGHSVVYAWLDQVEPKLGSEKHIVVWPWESTRHNQSYVNIMNLVKRAILMNFV